MLAQPAATKAPRGPDDAKCDGAADDGGDDVRPITMTDRRETEETHGAPLAPGEPSSSSTSCTSEVAAAAATTATAATTVAAVHNAAAACPQHQTIEPSGVVPREDTPGRSDSQGSGSTSEIPGVSADECIGRSHKSMYMYCEGAEGRVRKARVPGGATLASLRDVARDRFGKLFSVVASGEFFMSTKAKDAFGDVICYELMTDEDVDELPTGSTIVLKSNSNGGGALIDRYTARGRGDPGGWAETGGEHASSVGMDPTSHVATSGSGRHPAGKGRQRRSSKEKLSISASDMRSLRRSSGGNSDQLKIPHSFAQPSVVGSGYSHELGSSGGASASYQNHHHHHHNHHDHYQQQTIGHRGGQPSLSSGNLHPATQETHATATVSATAEPTVPPIVYDSSQLYSNVFPSHILEALQTDVGEDIANQHSSVSVLMADIVGFTKWCAGVSPVTIIQCLSAYFQILDDIAETLGVYKVETIGDGYQAVCGAPLPNDNHAAVLARFALKIIETVPHMRNIFNEPAFDVRVGINSGPIVTGVIRADRPRWQLFGDTVNYASRMESTSEPGRVQVSRLTHDLLLLSDEFELEKRGWLDIKGRGLQETFFLKSFKGVDIHSDSYLSSSLDIMLSPTPSGHISSSDHHIGRGHSGSSDAHAGVIRHTSLEHASGAANATAATHQQHDSGAATSVASTSVTSAGSAGPTGAAATAGHASSGDRLSSDGYVGDGMDTKNVQGRGGHHPSHTGGSAAHAYGSGSDAGRPISRNGSDSEKGEGHDDVGSGGSDGQQGSVVGGNGSYRMDRVGGTPRSLCEGSGGGFNCGSLHNGKPSVFLVDDMLSILLQYKRVLQKANISVSTARDGLEALDVMKNRYFTVVFCDITMPRMDGVACIKAFREWERETQRHRRQIVYALTGTSTDQVDEYLAAGFDSVISKNNSKKILLKYVFDATKLSGEMPASMAGAADDGWSCSSQHTTDDEGVGSDPAAAAPLAPMGGAH